MKYKRVSSIKYVKDQRHKENEKQSSYSDCNYNIKIGQAIAKEDEALRTRLEGVRKEYAEIHHIVKTTKIPDLAPHASAEDKEVIEGMQLARSLKVLRLRDRLTKA